MNCPISEINILNSEMKSKLEQIKKVKDWMGSTWIKDRYE